MDISGWWPKLSDASRQWLIDHNGEAVPPEIVGEIDWNRRTRPRRAGTSVGHSAPNRRARR